MPIRAASLQLGPWPDGVIYSRPAEDLPASALYAMQNCVIGAGGELMKRNGFTLYEDAAVAGSPAPTLTWCAQHRFSSSSTSTWIVAGTKIYEYVTDAWVDRTAALTITAGTDNTFTSANAAGTAILTNGVNAPLKIAAAAGNAALLDVDSRFTTAKWCGWWDNRAWFGNLSSGTRRIWRSDAGDVETYGATAFYTLDEDVTGLIGYRNMLTAHTENGIWGLYPTGNADAPYTLQKRCTKGTIAGRSIVTTAADTMLFVRRDGVYEWAPGISDVPTKISGALDGARYWGTLNGARLPYAHAVEYPNEHEVWFWLPYGASQSTMNHVMVWDYQARRWEGPLVVTRNCSALIDNKPHAGGVATGLLYVHDTGEHDNSDGIDAWAETASPAPMGSSTTCRWLMARHFFDAEGTQSVQVTQVSPEVVSRTDSFDLGTAGDLIGTTFRIAYSRIGADGERSSADTPLWGYSPSTLLRYRNGNASEPFTIRHAQLHYRPIGIVPKEASGIE